jgi:signal transduction histidine kinase
MTPAGEIEFGVADDGPGFDPTAISLGNGFTNMRDRLGAFGGILEVTTARDPGRD